ncbi:MAG: hypothetical protein HOM86_23480 [Gemmatimonadetes bacterium]|jgi:hypothetical protein|nr:hypothetical protein [Gemmatimonadota bacterium]MDE0961720.1 hypothetical protein [Candidatus Latescibacterota bacterium]
MGLMQELQRINIKMYLEDPEALSAEEAFRVFNSWIPTTPDEVLIDVADYSHVPEGPVTLLVGHEANYSLDNDHAEPGLLYSRKRPAEGDLSARLSSALQAVIKACQRLESEPSLDGKVKFRGGDILLVANDRLNATNDEEGENALRAELEPVLAKLFAGASFAIERDTTSQLRLNLRVRCDTDANAATLLSNLAA